KGLYLYAPGGLPVLLAAHLDTVHPSPPAEIFHDREKGVLWSPQGLGADDRAGVLAVLHVLKQGYRPHVLFCDREESGGLGAREAVKRLPRPDVAFVLGLDRRGAGDYVMYGWRSPELEAMLERHGFRQALGTFSDIAVLCPAWEIPGANLSVGFYQEHSKAEHLRLPELCRTAGRVCRMLQEIPAVSFSYVEEPPDIPERAAGWWEDTYPYRDNDSPFCLGRRTAAKKYRIVQK
ncbi:MAG: M28 family peptidase, partial [Desulfotomaculales bacterium]